MPSRPSNQSVSWKELDRLIRDGRITEAQRALRGIRSQDLPRDELVRFASLLRRGGLPHLVVRLLNPIVRPSQKLARKASDPEISEYAIAIVRVGAVAEGLDLLKGLRHQATPDVLLHRSLALFSIWDYETAVPLLENYVKLAPSEYQGLVGQVNLAAALVANDRTLEASRVLDSFMKKSRSGDATRLLGNCWGLRAQLEISEGRYREARRSLEEARKILPSAGGVDEFILRKWMAILEFRRSEKSGADAGLVRIEREALERKHWETLRDCAFQRVKVTRSPDLAARLYVGTPYEGFRRRLLRNCGSWFAPPDFYDWWLFGRAGSRILDLSQGKEIGSDLSLKAGQLLHRMISSLASDLYRPQRTASLFLMLFPGEYYSPDISSRRVHEGVARLRRWFDRHRLPLAVIEVGGAYRLQASRPYTIRTWKHGSESDSSSTVKMSRFRRDWRGDVFTTCDLARVLALPRSSASRLIAESIAEARIASIGKGPATKYRFR